jgi:hypothetical protein
MNKTIKELKTIFESISCLCAEGSEFCTKLELTDAIQRDAMKGYKLCKKYQHTNKFIEVKRGKICHCVDSSVLEPIEAFRCCTCGGISAK